MKLTEILSEENNNRKFKCIDNNFIVRNDRGTLLYLNKKFEDGTENWNNCIISKVWINAEYEMIDCSTIQEGLELNEKDIYIKVADHLLIARYHLQNAECKCTKDNVLECNKCAILEDLKNIYSDVKKVWKPSK